MKHSLLAMLLPLASLPPNADAQQPTAKPEPA